MKAVIVLGDFYPDISEGLLGSCRQTLQRHNIDDSWVIRVPGALEIPHAIKQVHKQVSLAVALGCVIRGETYHFEVVSQVSAQGIQQVQLQTNLPIGNGILTVENHAQAMARLNKGASAASAAITLAMGQQNNFGGNG